MLRAGGVERCGFKFPVLGVIKVLTIKTRGVRSSAPEKNSEV